MRRRVSTVGNAGKARQAGADIAEKAQLKSVAEIFVLEFSGAEWLLPS
jgi:hypothetical protein